jgi:hypothetical protein
MPFSNTIASRLMNRTIKRVPPAERKPAVAKTKDGKILSRRERLEQVHRNVKGALHQLEQLLKEEQEQAGN